MQVYRLFVGKARERIEDERMVDEGGSREWSARGVSFINLPELFRALRSDRKELESSFRHMGQAAFNHLKSAAKEAMALANMRNLFHEEASTQETLVQVHYKPPLFQFRADVSVTISHLFVGMSGEG